MSFRVICVISGTNNNVNDQKYDSGTVCTFFNLLAKWKAILYLGHFTYRKMTYQCVVYIKTDKKKGAPSLTKASSIAEYFRPQSGASLTTG